MKIRPYIGITDFTGFSQVEKMLRVFGANKAVDSQRILHVGVMMSYKTLHGMETEWSKAFPPKETIADIFASDDAYNCLHYADYKHDHGFAEDLCQAIGYGGIGIRAVQLDMTWPDPGQIAHAIHTSRKNIEVILQVGKKALEQTGPDPDTIVETLRNYTGIIHRVLLDGSMGRGVPMNANILIPVAQAIRHEFPDFGLVVAGGLGPDTIGLIEPIIQKFPDTSIDAQGKLRPSGNALDPIDWKMAETYLVKALEILQ